MINFPTSLDTITNPDAAGGDTLLSVPHDAQHGTANDILEALEAKVGIDSSAVETSHDYLLAGLESGKANVDQTMYIGTTGVNINRTTAALTLAGLTLTTPNLGTPSAGTLTNCTFPTLNQNTTGTAANLSGTPTLPNGTLATTQGASDNSTKLATTAYVDAAGGGGGATQLSELSDVVSATNTDKFALMANGTTGYVGRALVEADISDLGTYAATNQQFYIGTTQIAINRASAALTLAGLTLTTPNLGTPSAGTLTNCTFPTLNQNTSGTSGGTVANAVTLAMMAHGTDGNLITYNSAGAPAYVVTGDADQVLTSNGAGAAPSFQTPDGGDWNNGETTFDLSSASGDQVIAHNLGRTPKYVRISGFQTSGSDNKMSIGSYNGTTTSCIYNDHSGAGTSDSYVIRIFTSAANQTATIAVDATNITLSWTKAGSPTGTAYIMWEAA